MPGDEGRFGIIEQFVGVRPGRSDPATEGEPGRDLRSPKNNGALGPEQGRAGRGRERGSGSGAVKRSPLIVLCAAVLIDMIGFGIILPLLPFYAESMGASPLEVTLLIASYSATQLVAAPVWGRFSDRRGRRPLLVASLFASAVSYLIFGLADSLWLLFASRIAAGAAGGTVTLAQAYVADATTAEERA